MRHMVPTNHHPNMFAWISNVGKYGKVILYAGLPLLQSRTTWSIKIPVSGEIAVPDFVTECVVSVKMASHFPREIHRFIMSMISNYQKKNALLRHVSRLRLSQHPNFKRQPSLPSAYAAKAVTRFFFRAVLSGQLCLKVCQQCFPSPMPLADRAIDLTRTGVRAFLFTIECLKYLKVFSHLLRTHDLAITVNTAVGQTAHRNPQLNRTRFIPLKALEKV